MRDTVHTCTQLGSTVLDLALISQLGGHSKQCNAEGMQSDMSCRYAYAKRFMTMACTTTAR